REPQPADLSQIKRISIRDRMNLVKVTDFAKVPDKNSGFMTFLESLPTIKHRTNAAESLSVLVHRIIDSKDSGKPVTWALGPHIIKYGLSPLIIEMMDQGVVQCILTNGAGAIHDTEIALIGETSEEMAGHISQGTFGMAEETGAFINQAVFDASNQSLGFGQALGKKILSEDLPFKEFSIIAQAVKRHIPVTVHVAIGTDIIHMHPDMDGKATGEATFTDFRLFVSIMRLFANGGVHLNIGSTVVLPEVFVKASTCANNLNKKPFRQYTTANFDHLSEYRPLMNVVRRGSLDGGEGFEIIGRMEIMIPLFIRLLLAALRKEN
ncbi:hypothetical protein JW979_09005, partial [bacterium]|nr:hypothetical protein [candidate division CSSED10-310 bacterium]